MAVKDLNSCMARMERADLARSASLSEKFKARKGNSMSSSEVAKLR